MRCCTPCCSKTLSFLMINFCQQLLFKQYPSPEFNINFLVLAALPNIEFGYHLTTAPNNNIIKPHIAFLLYPFPAQSAADGERHALYYHGSFSIISSYE